MRCIATDAFVSFAALHTVFLLLRKHLGMSFCEIGNVFIAGIRMGHFLNYTWTMTKIGGPISNLQFNIPSIRDIRFMPRFYLSGHKTDLVFKSLYESLALVDDAVARRVYCNRNKTP